MRCSALALLALGLALPALATAQTPANPQNRTGFFEKLVQLDANGNQAIEAEEVPESARASFGRILEQADANKNGKLEIEELRGVGEKLRGMANPGEAEERFRAMDADNDGKVSAAEYKGPEGSFGRIDADGDGFIDKSEATRAFRGGAGDPMRRRLAAMDVNGDGKVAHDEFQGPQPLFDRLDTNKDGAISPDDRPSPADRPALRKAEIPPTRRPEGPSLPLAALGRRFMNLDKDGDGKVSKEEFQGPAEGVFDRVDADHDGGISREELRAAAERFRDRASRPDRDGPAPEKSEKP